MFEIDVRPQVDDLANRPAESNSNDAAENPHGSGFGKEKFSYISVAGPDSLHNADFAASFENCHDQRVHDSDGSDRQGKATDQKGPKGNRHHAAQAAEAPHVDHAPHGVHHAAGAEEQ